MSLLTLIFSCHGSQELVGELFYVKLKGYRHRDFAICWSKQLEYLTKNLSSNTKFLLDVEHREETVKWSVFSDFIGVDKKNLKKLATFFK